LASWMFFVVYPCIVLVIHSIGIQLEGIVRSPTDTPYLYVMGTASSSGFIIIQKNKNGQCCRISDNRVYIQTHTYVAKTVRLRICRQLLSNLTNMPTKPKTNLANPILSS
jgi:hypothetical protein